MSAKIISVAHRKGGVGKTSITLHLATALATQKQYKVIVLDTDSQRSATSYRQHEQDNVYPTQEPPYPIISVQPKYLYDEIRSLRDKYDVIFIDVPRLTESGDDSQLSTAITYCDYVLIPIIAGDLEGLSTVEFIELVQGIDKYKAEKEYSFNYYGFLNRRDRRRENDEAIAYMGKLNVPMLKNNLANVKALSRPYTFESVLDSKEGERRFKAFFNEFLKTAEL